MSAPTTGLETTGEALARGRRVLGAAGIESAALDARLLVATALEATVSQVIAHPELPLTAVAAARYEALLRRRAAREPMAHILGRREFWSLDFEVTADTLTPRPDSETLVAAVLELVPDRTQALRILDLGTGTGCLLMAILHELPQATGLGIDVSAAALAVAERNARRLDMADRAAFRVGEWAREVREPFDIVVSNPPYIRTGELSALAPEVRREPMAALDGGGDGLESYRALAPDLVRILAPGGVAVLEIGEGQAAAVETILADVGLVPRGRRADLAGIDRCIVARASPHSEWRGEA